MWDPKPDAPAEYRGEFGVMNTNVPGILLSDMLPMCARIQDKWSIIRSLHHNDAGHSSGDQICFTGYPSGPNPDENVFPSCGSIVARQLGAQSPQLPAYVMIPRILPGANSGYLGVAYKPFETQADPASPGPFRVPNFSLPAGVTVEQVGDRRGLLQSFDSIRRDIDNSGQLSALDRYTQQAWDIVTSNAARDAFDIDREPLAVRERYGFMPAFDPGAANRCGAPAWSQRILLARRLVEAGVRLVTVDLRWWDTHVLGFDSLRRGFLPRFDQAYSALMRISNSAASWNRQWSSHGANSGGRHASTTMRGAIIIRTCSARLSRAGRCTAGALLERPIRAGRSPWQMRRRRKMFCGRCISISASM